MYICPHDLVDKRRLLKSLRLFFMARYDLDRSREFVKNEDFSATFDIAEATRDTILQDDMALP